MFHEAEVSHGGGNICDIRSPVAQQRCGRSRPPTLLRCWAVQAIARQVRVDDRLTDRLVSIIIISKQKKQRYRVKSSLCGGALINAILDQTCYYVLPSKRPYTSERKDKGHEPWWGQLPTEPRIRPLSWHGVFPLCQEPEELSTSFFWWRPLVEVETSVFR